uniref:Nephrocystin 3-like N-terminal domain-containing protein n=1 Tax=Globisporangium ultimum (strain ATCC 200006 / CBS 805.95 / DAOM BR144) TaxID=431595 RepID=K3W9U3_GLOUD
MMKLKNKLSSSKSKERKRVERAQSDGVRATADEDALRMSKHVAEDAHRYARNTTMNTSAASSTSSYMSDDVEDMFYNGGGGITRSTSDYTTGRTTSSMRDANGMNRSTSLRVTDVYRTTEQLRNTNLMPLNEDEVLPAAMRTTTGAAGGSEADALRAELVEMKQEMQTIRREMMNEMHVTRYDVLKEITMLKGTIIQLVAALESKGVRTLDAGGVAEPQPELSPAQLDTITRTTAVHTSKATKDRLAAREVTAIPTIIRGTNSRLTQLAPVADDALSTPLLQHQIDDMFPLVDFSADLQLHAQKFDPTSREWAFERFQDWVDSRFNVGGDNLLALVGDGGSGKSTLVGALCDRFHDNIVALHLCKFDRKSKSSPRNVLLSLVNQLIANLPLFKNQLARLNLKYVLEETDPLVLARKVLVDPLCALEEPLTAKVLLVDGIDQCKSKDRNDLLDFLAAIIPEFPTWLGIFITSKPSPELPAKLAITSLLDFSPKNANYMNDTIILINDIIGNFSDKDVSEARDILKRKSGGNFTFLDFTKQALSHPGMEEENGYVPLDVLHDLPESIYEIYDEIFEDKFGKGHNRLWKKVQPLLDLIVTAASGPYALITEEQAQEQFSLSRDDIRMIRRAFTDIIDVRHGTYRMETSAMYEWLVDPQRSGEQFYVNISASMDILRRLHRKSSTDTHSVASSESSSHHTPSNVSTASSYLSLNVPPPAAPAQKVNFKPVGILKKK